MSSSGLFENLVSVLDAIMNNELVNEGREIHLRIKHLSVPWCNGHFFANSQCFAEGFGVGGGGVVTS